MAASGMRLMIRFPPSEKSVFCTKKHSDMCGQVNSWKIKLPKGKYEIKISVGSTS